MPPSQPAKARKGNRPPVIPVLPLGYGKKKYGASLQPPGSAKSPVPVTPSDASTATASHEDTPTHTPAFEGTTDGEDESRRIETTVKPRTNITAADTAAKPSQSSTEAAKQSVPNGNKMAATSGRGSSPPAASNGEKAQGSTISSEDKLNVSSKAAAGCVLGSTESANGASDQPPTLPAGHAKSNRCLEMRAPPPPRFNGHPNNRARNLHQSNPSNGSVVFGGLPESNNSSPAPLSGGHPPPSQALESHAPSGHNRGPSFGHVPPPGGVVYVPVTAVDAHGIGAISPFDAYAPAPPSYDPSTPHSFQGSHSSVQPDPARGAGTYGFPPTIMNGTDGLDNGRVPSDRANGQHQPLVSPGPPPDPRNPRLSVGPGLQPFPAMPPMDDGDGLLAYLSAQFADPEVADYMLELRYSDDRAPPVCIPGHNLIFARSPTLKRLMRERISEGDPGADGPPVMRVILLESDDMYLRSDAFWMAVQRLYGRPLLGFPAVAAMPLSDGKSPALTLAGTNVDRFLFALGYAASGRLLQMEPVVLRGIQAACQLINWETLEKALDFAYGEAIMFPADTVDDGRPMEQRPQQPPRYKYGAAVQMLVDAVAAFIIDNFPPAFVLDTTVGNPRLWRRIPDDIDRHIPRATQPHEANVLYGQMATTGSAMPMTGDGPVIARGSCSVQTPRPMPGPAAIPGRGGPVDQRLSGIRFGDLVDSGHESEPDRHGPSGQPTHQGFHSRSASGQLLSPGSFEPPNSQHVQTLSCILLNVPFHFLKHALETNVAGARASSVNGSAGGSPPPGMDAGVAAWATAAARHRAIEPLVRERERRRVAALHVLARDRALSYAWSGSSSAMREAELGDLGWCEEVVWDRGPMETARIVRRWVGLGAPPRCEEDVASIPFDGVVMS